MAADLKTLLSQLKPSKLTNKVKVLRSTLVEVKPNAMLAVLKQALTCSDEEFEEAWNFRSKVERTPNRWKAGTFVKRIQGTFGATYAFGNQTCKNLGSVDTAPAVVQRCVEIAKSLANEYACTAGQCTSSMYTGAHCNWYEDVGSGLTAHSDEEPNNLIGAPIFSFSLLRTDSPKQDYRVFRVLEKTQAPASSTDDKKAKPKLTTLLDVNMQDGDLLIMSGERFQKDLLHSVPPMTSKAFKEAQVRRINVTVRAWNNQQHVRDNKPASKASSKASSKPPAKPSAKPIAKPIAKKKGANLVASPTKQSIKPNTDLVRSIKRSRKKRILRPSSPRAKRLSGRNPFALMTKQAKKVPKRKSLRILRPTMKKPRRLSGRNPFAM